MSHILIDAAIWARLEPSLPEAMTKRGRRHGQNDIAQLDPLIDHCPEWFHANVD